MMLPVLDRIRPSRFILMAVFLAAVSALQGIDVSWTHYRQAGPIVLAYIWCRLVLLICLFILCLTMGALVLRKKINALPDLIYSFFCGASLYALLGVGMGFLGLLKFWPVLAVTAPVLYFFPSCVSFPSRPFEKFRKIVPDAFDWKILYFLGSTLLFGGGAIFLAGVLYPGPIHSDEWEHYLHYYRRVLDAGSLLPNEIWYHFYTSKGAGLFFLGGALSDFFAAQLVSGLFLVMTAVICFHLLNAILKSFVWALSGVIVLLAFYDGDFFRHHVVIAGFIAFFVWASIQVWDRRQALGKAEGLVLAVSAFYFGFYVPPGAVLIVVFFTVLGGASFIIKQKNGVPFFLLSAAGVSGAGTALAVNYGFTGLAEMVPMKFFWYWVNLNKFSGVFGADCAQFFLFEQENMGRIMSLRPMSFTLWLEWFGSIFRAEVLKFLVVPAALLFAAGWVGRVFKKRRLNSVRVPGEWILVFTVFFAVAFSISQFMMIESTIRFFSFMTFFWVVSGIVLIRVSAENLPLGGLKRGFNAALCAVLSVLALAQMAFATDTVRMQAMASYFTGGLSMEGVVREASRHFISVGSPDFFTRVRQTVDPKERVMSLSYFPSPGYFLPGGGLISQPSYTLGPRQTDIYQGTPEQAREILEGLDIHYFILNRQSIFLPTTIIVGKIFQAENMNRMFKLVLANGDNFLLTWRGKEDGEDLPISLLQTMELRQNRVLQYPFSEDFYHFSADFARQLGEMLRLMPEGPEDRLDSYIVSSITGILREKMLANIAIAGNKVLLEDLIRGIEDKILPEIKKLARESVAAKREAIQRFMGSRLEGRLIPVLRAVYTEKTSQDTLGIFRCVLTFIPNKTVRKVS